MTKTTVRKILGIEHVPRVLHKSNSTRIICKEFMSRSRAKGDVEPQPKIPKLHDIRSHNRSDYTTHYHWMNSDQSTAQTREAYGYESDRSTLWATDMRDLIGLMSNRLPTTCELYTWPETAEVERREEAEAEACECAPERSEATICPPVSNAPPRRFYRTFWRAMARKALMRVD
jgi:hypothetical protein